MSRVEDGGAVEAGRDLAAWLEAAATYFEKRPTNDEDRAHWANVFNAENCRKAAAEITCLRAENAGMREALKPFARFSVENVGSDGESPVWLSSTQRERICDWFGPTNFALARAALSKASQAEGQTP